MVSLASGYRPIWRLMPPPSNSGRPSPTPKVACGVIGRAMWVEPINIGSERTPLVVGSSQPPEMAGLIQGLTWKIIHSMEELKERLPQLRGEAPTISSSIREGREETYTHTRPMRMNDESSMAHPTHQEAPTPGITGSHPTMKVVASLQKQINSLIERVSGQMRR
ncbi:hypothetical protein LIER_20226 [Lithospermum erythrorhizon]|uniref:Uncharacterized protein n=1 Tax=Lithospermum erythrorhizon TaxID=34254 RepID=A0AAV3QLM5_LITER